MLILKALIAQGELIDKLQKGWPVVLNTSCSHYCVLVILMGLLHLDLKPNLNNQHCGHIA